jgi:hypothetical protein
MAKSNPVSLSGMQAALRPDDAVSEEMLSASSTAVENAVSNLNRTGKNVIYKLVDTNIRGNFHLILVCDVKARPTKDKDGNLIPNNGNERMRALRGVETVWVKEQKDLDKDYIKANKRYQVFQKGIAIVPEYDTQAIEILDRHNGNIDNPNPAMPCNTKFFKWNPAKQAEQMRKKQDERIKAILLANEVEIPAMKKHAAFLQIPFVYEFGEPLTDDGIRVRYRYYADSNPKLFLESINSKEVEVSYLVKRAMIDAKIDTGRANNAVHWAEGGFICKVPASQTAQKYLVEFAMTNSEDGRNFLKELQERVS